MVIRLAHCRCHNLTQGRGPEAVEQLKKLHGSRRDHMSEENNVIRGIFAIRNTVDFLITLITVALSSLTTLKFRPQIAGVDDQDQPWPQSSEDLLPAGLPGSVQGLENWTREKGGTSKVFSLAKALSTHYRPFALALLQPPDYTFAISRPLVHLTAVMDFYQYHSKSTSTPGFEDTASAVFDFFQVFFMQDPADTFDEMIRAKVDEMAPVFERLAAIISSFPGRSGSGPAPQDQWSEILIGIQLFLSLGGKRTTLDAGVAQLAQDMVDPVRDAVSGMAEARKGGCANLLCPKKIGSVYAKLCSKCDLIRFCGPECQQMAWKSPPLPHKAICAKIYALRILSLPRETWVALWKIQHDRVRSDELRSARTVNGNAVDMKLVTEIGKTLTAERAFKEFYRARYMFR
ncbi:hypothetical protein DFP72DRAFT_1047739 [Ephemerocybe angulata]|uniref:MYND-type domain-containing protein n=1 Tax=Ephemerocybe angulata TaxID=980116 RepID=A0A8H6HS41_9AGAR|nr:hypothetical protein DFP72DRAFT_1047739 [Tulosesus angulatus]